SVRKVLASSGGRPPPLCSTDGPCGLASFSLAAPRILAQPCRRGDEIRIHPQALFGRPGARLQIFAATLRPAHQCILAPVNVTRGLPDASAVDAARHERKKG